MSSLSGAKHSDTSDSEDAGLTTLKVWGPLSDAVKAELAMDQHSAEPSRSSVPELDPAITLQDALAISKRSTAGSITSPTGTAPTSPSFSFNARYMPLGKLPSKDLPTTSSTSQRSSTDLPNQLSLKKITEATKSCSSAASRSSSIVLPDNLPDNFDIAKSLTAPTPDTPPPSYEEAVHCKSLGVSPSSTPRQTSSSLTGLPSTSFLGGPHHSDGGVPGSPSHRDNNHSSGSGRKGDARMISSSSSYQSVHRLARASVSISSGSPANSLEPGELDGMRSQPGSVVLTPGDLGLAKLRTASRSIESPTTRVSLPGLEEEQEGQSGRSAASSINQPQDSADRILPASVVQSPFTAPGAYTGEETPRAAEGPGTVDPDDAKHISEYVNSLISSMSQRQSSSQPPSVPASSQQAVAEVLLRAATRGSAATSPTKSPTRAAAESAEEAPTADLEVNGVLPSIRDAVAALMQEIEAEKEPGMPQDSHIEVDSDTSEVDEHSLQQALMEAAAAVQASEANSSELAVSGSSVLMPCTSFTGGVAEVSSEDGKESSACTAQECVGIPDHLAPLSITDPASLVLLERKPEEVATPTVLASDGSNSQGADGASNRRPSQSEAESSGASQTSAGYDTSSQPSVVMQGNQVTVLPAVSASTHSIAQQGLSSYTQANMSHSSSQASLRSSPRADTARSQLPPYHASMGPGPVGGVLTPQQQQQQQMYQQQMQYQQQQAAAALQAGMARQGMVMGPQGRPMYSGAGGVPSLPMSVPPTDLQAMQARNAAAMQMGMMVPGYGGRPAPSQSMSYTPLPPLRDYPSLLYCDGRDRVGRPVVVLNSAALPGRAQREHALELVLKALQPIVQKSYVLVVVNMAAPTSTSDSSATGTEGSLDSMAAFWAVSAYQKLERDYRKNVKQIVLVAPSTWARLLLVLAKPLMSSKADSKIKKVTKLKELEEATNKEVTLSSLGYRFLRDARMLPRGDSSSGAAAAMYGGAGYSRPMGMGMPHPPSVIQQHQAYIAQQQAQQQQAMYMRQAQMQAAAQAQATMQARMNTPAGVMMRPGVPQQALPVRQSMPVPGQQLQQHYMNQPQPGRTPMGVPLSASSSSLKGSNQSLSSQAQTAAPQHQQSAGDGPSASTAPDDAHRDGSRPSNGSAAGSALPGPNSSASQVPLPSQSASATPVPMPAMHSRNASDASSVSASGHSMSSQQVAHYHQQMMMQQRQQQHMAMMQQQQQRMMMAQQQQQGMMQHMGGMVPRTNSAGSMMAMMPGQGKPMMMMPANQQQVIMMQQQQSAMMQQGAPTGAMMRPVMPPQHQQQQAAMMQRQPAPAMQHMWGGQPVRMPASGSMSSMHSYDSVSSAGRG